MRQVRGFAPAGATVTVTLLDASGVAPRPLATAHTTPGPDGAWAAMVGTLAADLAPGGPYTLEATSNTNAGVLRASDLRVGEVWLVRRLQ